jgi:CubicO group peptidase (beta-lactamase class C family)
MRCLLAVLLFATSASAQTSDWSRASLVDAHLNPSKLHVMEELAAKLEFKKLTSVLVARDGKLVYEKYFAGDASTLRNTRSAMKSLTSALIGLAIQDGKLANPQVRICDVLPDRCKKMKNPDSRKLKITVEDFMTMSSVLECDDWENFSQGNEERMYLTEDWAQFILDLPIGGRMRMSEKPEPPKYGREFHYCTGGVFTLSEVITKATGMRTDKYAQQKLFTPLGIPAERVQWIYSPLDVPMTGGGLSLTSGDLLRVGQMYLDGGKWNGKQLVNEAWVKATITPRAQIDDHTEYGYNWWLQSWPVGDKVYPSFYMTGNGGNKIIVLPSLHMTVVITAENYGQKDMHKLAERVLTEFVLAAVE